MTDSNTRILELCENLAAYYESDYGVPTEILEELEHMIEVELRERDEEGA